LNPFPPSSAPPPRGILLRFFLTLFLGAMVLGPLLYLALGGAFPFHRVMNRALLISALAALGWAWPQLPLRAWWPLHRGAAGQVLLGLLIALVSLQTILGLEIGLGGLTWAVITPHDRARIVFTALVAALLVPPTEETIFRGFLQTEFSRRLGLRAGWIAAALIFALAHFLKIPVALDHEPVHAWSGVTAVGTAFGPLLHGAFLNGHGLNLLLIGLILGGLFWRTGMLWLNYGLHGGWILGLLLASGLTRPAPTVSIWTGRDLLSSPLTSLVLVLLGFWLWLFFRRPPPEPERPPASGPGANAP
jgi:membrane protease YdiL (CAAX protease family)